MKKMLMALAAVAVFASCEQKTETHNDDMDTDVIETPTDVVIDNIDEVLITDSEANAMIQAYHQSIGLKDNPDQNVSFEINATILRDYLNSKPTIKKLDVYLAKGADDKMTLVYIGAKDSAGFVVEMPYKKPGDPTGYAMDNVYPCPTCPRIAIHQQPTEQ